MRFILLASSHAGQRGEASAERAIDGVGDRAATAAAMTGTHAGQAVGIGQDTGAWEGAGCCRHAATNGRAAGYAGKVAVIEFGAGHRLIDAPGRVGIDGGRVGVFATTATDRNRLNVAVENNHAIAFSLNIETEQCAGC